MGTLLVADGFLYTQPHPHPDNPGLCTLPHALPTLPLFSVHLCLPPVPGGVEKAWLWLGQRFNLAESTGSLASLTPRQASDLWAGGSLQLYSVPHTPSFSYCYCEANSSPNNCLITLLDSTGLRDLSRAQKEWLVLLHDGRGFSWEDLKTEGDSRAGGWNHLGYCHSRVWWFRLAASGLPAGVSIRTPKCTPSTWDGLGFLPRWQLSAKIKCPKRTTWKL